MALLDHAQEASARANAQNQHFNKSGRGEEMNALFCQLVSVDAWLPWRRKGMQGEAVRSHRPTIPRADAHSVTVFQLGCFSTGGNKQTNKQRQVWVTGVLEISPVNIPASRCVSAGQRETEEED